MRVKSPKLWNRMALYWSCLAVFIIGFFLWGMSNLSGFTWDDDEGVFLMTARMVQLGHSLYTDVWFNYPPGFFLVLAVFFKLFGSFVSVGRAAIVIFATVGLLGIALIVQKLGGRIGAIAAVALLMLTPHFFELSRTVMADLPAATLATLSIAFMLYYMDEGRRRWLIIAGVTLSAGILVKPIVIFPTGLLILAVLLRHLEEEEKGLGSGVVTELGILILSLFAPLLFCFAVYDGHALYSQVIGTYFKAKQAYTLDVTLNAKIIWLYLTSDKYGLSHYGLMALALYGLIRILKDRQSKGLLIAGWLFLTLIVLLIHSPLREHQLIILLFPLTSLSGVAAAQLYVSLTNLPSRRFSSSRLITPFIGLIGLGIFILELPGMVNANLGLLAAYEDDEARFGRDAVDFIKTITAPGDFIITDGQIIPFRAGIKVPPWLSNTSGMRINTGQLSAAQLIEISQRYKPKAIIFWEERLDGFPTYVDWVKQHYRIARWYDHKHRIYVPFIPPRHKQRANLDNKVLLLGYTIDDSIIKPGSPISVTLYWQVLRTIDINYTVFVHLLDKDNRMWGQMDKVPMGDTYPPKRWQPGDIILDEYKIPVGLGIPPGVYYIEVGMYDVLGGGERLPVLGEGGKRVDDRVILRTPLVVGGKRVFEVPEGIQHPIWVELGGKVALVGYDIGGVNVKPGGKLHLRLYWQAQRRMYTSYRVFTHIIDENGRIWGQKDGVPCGGKYPTTGWLPGEVVVDEYDIPVDLAIPGGEYMIEVGMYELETMKRLPAFDENGHRLPEDRILLEEKIQIRR